MEYGELVNLIERQKVRFSRFDVVSLLIGYQGKVDNNDWKNICKLYLDGFIDE